ncbi:glycosyltransferase family 2 protein [Natronococcus sp. JC468]|uniref:glycosyltransferase family 2 protein n=1 Tax=Natronococcus sp. JC468 TaxID=1961921 RepID=UPI00143B0DC0|nr:glycosyltransferase family 2 protein [Natronococcus sp. JC468]NKE36550.1 glycosyltransferase family 2 protein [Natronococcus sp. JC468]
MATNPKVSVIIPLYNREDTILRCIKSALYQTYKNYEIIVVDDCSDDDSVGIVDDINSNNIKLIRHNENKGGSAARNTGINQSNGEYIAFLDSDDVWHPLKIESQVNLLESRGKEWVASYCNVCYISNSILFNTIKNSNEKVEKMEGGSDLIPEVLSMNFDLGGSSTLLVKKETVDEIGGFNEEFDRHQDWEFLIRLLKIGKITHLPYPYVRKYSTSSPSIEKVKNAKYKLMSEFRREVAAAESNGYPVRKYHRLDLANQHMRNGSMCESLRLLSQSKFYLSGGMGFIKATLDRLFLNKIK